MAIKKGRITLTLVISRTSSDRPTVRRGLYRMNFFLFKVRTKIEEQVDEYIVWKARFSTYAAEIHAEILGKFIDRFKFKTITEIDIEHIETFYKEMEGISHFKIKSMEAIRGFMKYHRKQHQVNIDQISNDGVVHLPTVQEKVIIPPMKKRKPGRPPLVEFIKKVQRLKDKEGLSLRAIARAENRPPSRIHQAYHYDLSKLDQ